jgi:hypothetical protein
MIEGGWKPSRQPPAPAGPRAVFSDDASAPRRRDDGHTASPAMRPHEPNPNFMPFFEVPLMVQKFLHQCALLHFPPRMAAFMSIMMKGCLSLVSQKPFILTYFGFSVF